MTALPHPQRFVVGRLGVHDRLTRLQHTAGRAARGRGASSPITSASGSPTCSSGVSPLIAASASFTRMKRSSRSQKPIPTGAETSSVLSCAYDCCAVPKRTRVVDRERRSPRDLVRELEVDRAEAPSRLARAERDRPEQPPAGLERDDDVRGRFECAVELEVLLVDRRPGERLLARILDEVRLAAPEHLRDRMRVVLLRRIASPHLTQELLARRVAVRDHDLTQGPVLVERVDDAVVRDARHEQLGEIGERRLVVERGGKQGARLAEEVHPLLLAAAPS